MGSRRSVGEHWLQGHVDKCWKDGSYIVVEIRFHTGEVNAVDLGAHVDVSPHAHGYEFQRALADQFPAETLKRAADLAGERAEAIRRAVEAES